MKYKKLIITSIILIVVGILVSVITLFANQFNIGKLDDSIISKTYDINSEFDSIECDLEIGNLNIYLTTDNKNYALCLEKENVTFDVEVVNNVLKIKENYKYEFFSYTEPEVSLYINKPTFNSLNVETDTGDICILDSFNIKNINIDGDTNDVELMGVITNDITINVDTGDTWIDRVIANNITINATTGDIDVSNCIVNNNLDLKVTTGDVELLYNEIVGDLKVESDTGEQGLEHITCNNIILKATTGDIILEDVVANSDMTINTDTGSVELEYSDAINIYITTSTGRVEGSILTNKVFDAKSNTGKVSVPSSSTGGICKIRTSTGRISIAVE